jgi:hypothetical protein
MHIVGVKDVLLAARIARAAAGRMIGTASAPCLRPEQHWRSWYLHGHCTTMVGPGVVLACAVEAYSV